MKLEIELLFILFNNPSIEKFHVPWMYFWGFFSMTIEYYYILRRRTRKLFELASDPFEYTIYNKICPDQHF